MTKRIISELKNYRYVDNHIKRNRKQKTKKIIVVDNGSYYVNFFPFSVLEDEL